MPESTISVDVLNLIKGVGEKLISLKPDKIDGEAPDFFSARHPAQLSWCSPENLDTGMSGAILFLLAMYRQSGEERYLAAADEWISALLEYCRQYPTNNYGLYTGRCGFIYVLLQRYELDGQRCWLDTSLELIRPANEEFLQSQHTTDYLYCGRAGTLLLISRLYLLTQEDFLLDYLHQFVATIINRAAISSHGLSWGAEEEFNIGAPCGFAYGAAGIRYVFDRLNSGTNLFTPLIAAIDQYISHCWLPDWNNWGNLRRNVALPEQLNALLQAYNSGDKAIFFPRNSYSWSDGAIGIAAAYLDTGINYSGALRNRLNRLLLTEEHIPADLFSKALAWGMISATGQYLENEPGTWPDITAVSGLLLPGLEHIDLNGGLLRGDLGKAYLLLKTMDRDPSTENVLLPFFPSFRKHAKIPFNITATDIRKMWLHKCYPGVLELIDRSYPQLLPLYWQQTTHLKVAQEPASFARFLLQQARQQVPPAVFERLTDLFTFEKAKTDFAAEEKRTPLQIYLDSINYQENAIEWLNKPDAWLMDQRFVVSGKVKFINTRWDWTFMKGAASLSDERLQERLGRQLKEPPGEYSCLLQVFEKKQVVEYPLSVIPSLLLQCFREPKSVREAMEEIKLIFSSMPERAMQLLPKEFNHKEPAPLHVLLQEIDWVLLKHLRPLIYRNMLEKDMSGCSYFI